MFLSAGLFDLDASGALSPQGCHPGFDAVSAIAILRKPQVAKPVVFYFGGRNNDNCTEEGMQKKDR